MLDSNRQRQNMSLPSCLTSSILQICSKGTNFTISRVETCTFFRKNPNIMCCNTCVSFSRKTVQEEPWNYLLQYMRLIFRQLLGQKWTKKMSWTLASVRLYQYYHHCKDLKMWVWFSCYKHNCLWNKTSVIQPSSV